MGYKNRDVEVIHIGNDTYLVVACDSCGAIGSKEYDMVKVDPYIVGRHTSRVALMEILSVGAQPQAISVTISNEPYPTGEGILNGVKDELKYADLEGLPVCISTEKNISTSQTAIGVTIVATCKKDDLRIGTTGAGDLVYSLGLPKVGDEVKAALGSDIINPEDIIKLSIVEGVHDIIPVGSKGIKKEAVMLAESIGYDIIFNDGLDIDIHKSAGPATCLIFTCSPDAVIHDFNSTPLNQIGKVYRRDDTYG
jgi:hydrogenase maturation factor HypE